MGVPKFFRYISERYPCLSETVKDYQIPEFDNLYLDMNGIIHTCSHPDDGDPHFRITEEQIFKDIFHYIEVLFQMIRPRKLFFLAIDGVAPRAKMNQQRGRRFRSAKDALLLEEKAKAKGEVLPSEARFDSNCITPGTTFMANLHEQLKYFIINKISTDKSWQNCKVILSGHETPGEGEHKIMDYIRYLRAQPGYNPNTRHCLYGLDADLIMLGLCTHEPHFSLLREEVKFGKKAKRANVPEQINFYLLHLSLMREYLELEFLPLKDSLPFEFDLEKIIDDWVLMGFLVGNDFIPHLPNLHIHNGALPVLYNAYMKVLPTLDGYINEGGKLNLQRFSRFMEELSQIDIDKFQEAYTDLKYLEGKMGRKLEPFDANMSQGGDVVDCFPLDLSVGSESTSMNNDLANLIRDTDDMFADPENMGNSESESDDDFFKSEFQQHKTDYYMNKLDYEKVTPEVLRSQAEGYVRAIQWNLHYYYDGCCSWSWFYPHHYAPYISDIKDFTGLNIHFDLGKPFLPFQQLLAVLPAASKQLLPDVYQKLMTDTDSPIYKYYPIDFQTDLNGKRQEWEAVVLIPFIEEHELLEAMAPCDKKLTDEERRRNSHGPMLVYEYSVTSKGAYDSPNYFPRVQNNHTDLIKLTIDDIRIPPNRLIKGAYPGAKFDVYYPGFPTFKHLKYTGSLQKAGVKVFDIPSRGENMIVKIVQNDNDDVSISYLADKLLGRTIYVNWPHLTEAKVITIANNKERYELSNESISTDKKYHVIDNKDFFLDWKSSIRSSQNYYMSRLGVDVGTTEILIYAVVLSGRSYVFGQNGKFTLEKQWASVPSTFPYQTVVQDISVHDPNYIQYKDIKEVYPVGGVCFMLGFPHYGSEGVVIDHSESSKTGRIKVAITAFPEPDLTEVRKFERDLAVQYFSGYNAAQRLGISPHLFSRITGTVFIILGHRISPIPENASKINVGLNLKFNKRNEEIPGYTKKDGNNWLYSTKAIQLVKDYMDFCPELFEFMANHTGNDVFFESEMFPDSVGEDKVKDIAAWIKKQPYSSIERQVSGSKLLDPEVIAKLETHINDYTSSDIPGKEVTMQVKPRLLYMPELNIGNLPPDPKAEYFLYDRVVSVRESYTVPVGLKGTIIGIHEVQINNCSSVNAQNNVLYDVYFDHPFPGGLSLNCSANHGYRMSAVALINISHGVRLEQLKKGNVVSQDQKLSNTTNNLNAWKKVPNPQSTTSAFIPWQSNNNGFDNRNSQTFRNKYQISSVSPSSNNTDEQISSSNVKPALSASSLPKEAGPPITVPKKKPETNKSGVSEFQAIWNELHKLGKKKTSADDMSEKNSKTNNDENKPLPPLNSVNVSSSNKPSFLINSDQKNQKLDTISTSNTTTTSSTSIKETSSETCEKISQKSDERNDKFYNRATSLDSTSERTKKEITDSTEMLKMMLKIQGTSSENDSKEKQHPPSLEACAKPVQELFERAKAIVPKIPISNKHYTVELLNIYHQYGLGIPRYNYLQTPERLIRAQIFLPNGQHLIGAPATTREQASEYVAQLVLQDHSLLMDKTIYKGQFNSHLPAPPQQWFTRNIYINNNSPRKASQNYSANHQKNYLRSSSYNSDIHRNYSKSDNKNDTSIDPFFRSVNTSDKRNLTSQGATSFVPLQAIKQQRNRTLSGPEAKKNSKDTKTNENGDKKENTNLQSSLSNTVDEDKTTSTQKDTTTSKPIQQKKVRKSRIAANFSGAKK